MWFDLDPSRIKNVNFVISRCVKHDVQNYLENDFINSNEITDRNSRWCEFLPQIFFSKKEQSIIYHVRKNVIFLRQHQNQFTLEATENELLKVADDRVEEARKIAKECINNEVKLPTFLFMKRSINDVRLTLINFSTCFNRFSLKKLAQNGK